MAQITDIQRCGLLYLYRVSFIKPFVSQLFVTWDYSTIKNHSNEFFNILRGMTVDHQSLLKQFEHLNHVNPHTFEVDDLDRLIKSVGFTFVCLLNTTRQICMCRSPNFYSVFWLTEGH